MSWEELWRTPAMPLDRQAETQQIAMLERLNLVANEHIAQRIIEVEKYKWAKARVEMYDADETHMCSELGCLQPVAGKVIFEHCEKHLGKYEQEWFEDNVEAEIRASMREGEDELDVVRRWRDKPFVRSEDTISSEIRRALGISSGTSFMKRSRERSERLLDEARAYTTAYRQTERERWAYLPMSFHGDLRRAWQKQFRSAGLKQDDSEA